MSLVKFHRGIAAPAPLLATFRKILSLPHLVAITAQQRVLWYRLSLHKVSFLWSAPSIFAGQQMLSLLYFLA